MIYGIGTDMIETARVKKSMETIGGFREKIFGEAEIGYCESKANKYEHYAGRFAAKEAFMKAIGTGWRNGIAFREIEIVNDGLGKPGLKLSGKALGFTRDNGIGRSQISISHIKDMATAIVVLETEE
jgi:holo-[acyl-carrier protein] synthase